MKGRYTAKLNYEGNVVQSCIHCHQIGDARRTYYRSRGEPIPETVLYPFPHPKSLGLILDPKERARVTSVTEKTPAAQAGFLAGDDIVTLAGQPLLSMADVQWVLQTTPPQGGSIPAEVLRDGKTVRVTLKLEPGWRRADDIGWRASSWGLRRMSAGGLKLDPVDAEGRKRLDLAADAMALRVEHVGQYGPHATAKGAGFRVGDIITSFDGQTNLLRESDLLAYGVTTKKAGDTVAVRVIRDGKPVTLNLPMQK